MSIISTLFLQELPECVDTFELFLQFIYSRRVSMNSNTVKPLFLLADKYAISSLQELCSNYFKRHLSASTVLDVISFANKLHNQDLSDRQVVLSEFFCIRTQPGLPQDPAWSTSGPSLVYLRTQSGLPQDPAWSTSGPSLVYLRTQPGLPQDPAGSP